MSLDTRIDETNIDQLVAGTRQVSAWRLFPYSDGSFAFYPSGNWMKGYILTRDQAVSLFTEIEKKGISLTQLVILGSVGAFFVSRSLNVVERFGPEIL